MTEEATIAQTLICLNNEALGLFLEGRLTEAIEALSNAYSLFESFRERQQHHDESQASQVFSGEAYSRLELHPSSGQQRRDSRQNVGLQHDLFPKPLTSHSLTMAPPMQLTKGDRDTIMMDIQKAYITSLFFSSGESSAHSLYNRGLMLSVDPCVTSDGSSGALLLTSNQHHTSAILIYNMALCYHNMGSHLGVSSALLKALQLYEMALESIHQGTDLIQVQKLLMAILNNCANIYTYYRRTEETQRCFENLKIVLAASTIDMALDEDYDFFFLNAFFQSQELWLAPAA
jgi:tetratricopeptide (TPR) repeat protein